MNYRTVRSFQIFYPGSQVELNSEDKLVVVNDLDATAAGIMDHCMKLPPLERVFAINETVKLSTKVVKVVAGETAGSSSTEAVGSFASMCAEAGLVVRPADLPLVVDWLVASGRAAADSPADVASRGGAIEIRPAGDARGQSVIILLQMLAHMH